MNKILVDSSLLTALFNFSQNAQLDFLAWVTCYCINDWTNNVSDFDLYWLKDKSLLRSFLMGRMVAKGATLQAVLTVKKERIF